MSPLGSFLSLRLQFTLNDAIRKQKGRVTKRWWHTSRVRIPDDAMTDIRLLRSFLVPSTHQHLWTRPIRLLIPRAPTMTPISDASYDRLGGWALEHPCIWRLSKSDMDSCGFFLPKGKEPTDAEKDEKLFDHINILEFVAVLINVWSAVRYLMAQPVRNAQVIFKVLSDNTAALPWMQHAARTKRPAVRNLARFFQAMLTHCPLPVRLQGKHLIADLLSRFLLAPSWGSNVLNARSLQTLPSPARATVQACALAQVRGERGDVRSRNDATVDSRAGFFTEWLAHLAINDESLRTLTSGQALPLLGAFIHAVANEGFSSTGRLNLGANTIRGYLRAAKDWLAAHLDLVVDISAADGSANLHPFLSDTLASRQTWTEPKEKREAFTSAMYDFMFHDILSWAAKDTSTLFDLTAAIFDWTRLGAFTGSRVSEYAQTTARKGTFTKVLDSLDAGDWRIAPIAFMDCDFTLYDAAGRRVPFGALARLGHLVSELHVRFRFDKSPRNFTIRKFRRSGHKYMCPILAAISIIVWALALRVPKTAPIGVYRTSAKGSFTYLRSIDIRKRMKKVRLLAHPDPENYFHKHAKFMVSHSNRVTAAVALSNAGLSLNAIAFRPLSVQHYLRECSIHIGQLTIDAVKGATMI